MNLMIVFLGLRHKTFLWNVNVLLTITTTDPCSRLVKFMYAKGNLQALKASLCWVRFPAPAGFTHCSCRYCSNLTENNDYRLVASTSVVMKCFEKYMESLLKAEIRSELDPLQFAYRQYVTSWDALNHSPCI